MRVSLAALLLAAIGGLASPSPAQEVPHQTLPACAAGDSLLLLPDLVPDVPKDVRNIYQGSHRVLQFTTAVANIGDGPLVLEGRTISTAAGLVTQGYQIIWRGDGSRCARQTGRFAFHPGHQHFHFDAFVGYELRSGDPLTGPAAASGSKASFCLLDLAVVRGFSRARQVLNQSCASAEGMQGISVGWKDVYERFLPGQSIDLDQSPDAQVPNGSYFLVNVVDPNRLLWDKNPANNSSSVVVGVSLPAPDPGQLGPVPTPRPVVPHLKPGPVRPTRPPQLRPTRLPRVRPTLAPRVRPPRPPRERSVPAPTAAPPPATEAPLPTATPTPRPIQMTNCENACTYGISQARFLWYGGLTFSAVISPASCAPLSPDPGDQGTMQMVNFLTQRRRDTGHQHVASFALGPSAAGTTSAGGTIQFSRIVNSYLVTYSAPVPAIASQRDGAEFPVVFDICLTVGEQAVKTRLVCQPKSRGMLCHEG